MLHDFKPFAQAVSARFTDMAATDLFVVEVDRDEVWATYLAAYPEGSNPIFRERTEHDCSCCKNFIRDMANVVAIQNGVLTTIWDITGLDYPYQQVANTMAAYIRDQLIKTVFLTPFSRVGTVQNFEEAGGTVLTWNHFYADIPRRYQNANVEAVRSQRDADAQVLQRGLETITISSVDTIIDLAKSGGLYRGDAVVAQLGKFRQLLDGYAGCTTEAERRLYVWQKHSSPAARIRNTAIGTLLVDLSESPDLLEDAVRLYEAKVAPENYQRTSALITPRMIATAMDTIRELDLETALERRFARLSDVSVNSVLFVNNETQAHMKGGLEALLMDAVAPTPIAGDNAVDISIEDFVANVLPLTQDLKVLFKNEHMGNMVSLTAPVHSDTGRLFKWDNDFAWSYSGNVTDSIKEKVKRAGGQVEGVKMRVSLAWSNYDDLDLHVIEPDRNHISYSNKSNKLDVDMNAGSGHSRTPVENIRWVHALQDGVYKVLVHQYSKRENSDVGFTVELETDLGLQTLHYPKVAKGHIDVAQITVLKGKVVSVIPAPAMEPGSQTKDAWGLTTEAPVQVNAVVLSPNYWGEHATGHKHWFFMLEGCLNPEPTRGIYNEFLASELHPHRKVFEVLGAKTQCQPTPDQISGLGFTKGRGDKVLVKATGPKLNKTYTIAF